MKERQRILTGTAARKNSLIWSQKQDEWRRSHQEILEAGINAETTREQILRSLFKKDPQTQISSFKNYKRSKVSFTRDELIDQLEEILSGSKKTATE